MRSDFPTCVAGLFAAFALNLVGAERWNNPPRERFAELRHGTFRSASMKTDVGYNICLPPEYQRDAEQHFPVVYYLHGYEGSESSYLEYAGHWRNALAKSGPMILVFVNGGETSFFCDSPDGSVMGETVVKELVAHIDATYRTIPEARARSLHGYSMGGFGALKLAFKYPTTFGSAVSYGATLADAAEMKKHLGKVFQKMFRDEQRFQANDPFALAEANAAKLRDAVAVQIVIGSKDEFVDRNRALHRKLDALKIPVEFRELPGVKHKKDSIYEHAAEEAFTFSTRQFQRRVRASAERRKLFLVSGAVGEGESSLRF
jgi:endo-1,4-beta-xylanase